MEELVDKYGWKKVAAVLVAGSVLILGFVTVSFIDIDKATNKAEQKTIAVRTTSMGDDEETTKTHETPYYSISYPKTFTVVPQTTEGALSSVTFEDTYNATVEIQVFKASTVGLTDLAKPYANSSFTKSENETSLGKVTEYTGSVLGLHQKVALIVKGENIIRFIGSYSGGSVDQANEKIFSDMLSSMR
jgi:hypothetical protein